MSVVWFAKPPRKPAQKRRAVTVSLPAPVGGRNLVDAPGALLPIDAQSVTNLYAGNNGLTTRYGTQKWAANVGTSDHNLEWLIPTATKLFAVESRGIYDVTTSTDAPTLKLAFTAGNAFYSSSQSFTTIAGDFCLYADERNGYILYTAATDTWAAVASGGGAGQVSGIDPADVAFVATWKERVWLVKRDTAEAWYLPAGLVTGAATRFNFGSRFRKGGSLRGLWSWTIDGGAGIDDHLVAISSAGELLVWSGSDPDVADAFNLVGSWDLGSVPAGRRFAYNFAGDLLVWTRAGVISVSKLLSGVGVDQAARLTRKIQPYFATYGTSDAFFVEHPQERTLIGIPWSNHAVVMSKDTGGWFYYSLPFSVMAATAWNGNAYFAARDPSDNGLVVWKSVTGYDSKERDGTGGTPVNWRIMSRPIVDDFARHKTITEARGRFSGTVPTHGVGAAYAFDALVTSVPSVGASSSGWTGVSPIVGQATSGREAYIGIAGMGSATLAGIDVQLLVGGDS